MPTAFEQIAEDLINKGYAIYELDSDLQAGLENIYMAADLFFNLPISEKEQFANMNFLEGFRRQGIEYSQALEQPDLNESFSVWKRNVNNDIIAEWVSKSPLHRALNLVLGPLTDLGNHIFKHLKQNINPDGQPVTVSDFSYLQINFYEPYKHQREFLQESHEDGHLLTITTSTGPGLEIMLDGKYQPVTLSEKQVILMPGSILTLITGGLIKSLYHRVRNHKSIKCRKSFMFFINPSILDEQRLWIENDSNTGIDVRTVAIENSSHFGLPKIDILNH